MLLQNSNENKNVHFYLSLYKCFFSYNESVHARNHKALWPQQESIWIYKHSSLSLNFQVQRILHFLSHPQ